MTESTFLLLDPFSLFFDIQSLLFVKDDFCDLNGIFKHILFDIYRFYFWPVLRQSLPKIHYKFKKKIIQRHFKTVVLPEILYGSKTLWDPTVNYGGEK